MRGDYLNLGGIDAQLLINRRAAAYFYQK